MAYDPVKAHEYYENYIKKGLKKGRNKASAKKSSGKKSGSKKSSKKGSKASGKKTSLIGISTSGLNDAGRMQAAMVKETLTNEMNAALSKETTQEGKDRVRQEYQNKALAAMNKLKGDAKYATPKKGGSKGAKSEKSKAAKGGSKAAKESTTKAKSEKKISPLKATKGTVKSGGSSNVIRHDQHIMQRAELVNKANDLIKMTGDKIKNMTPEEKAKTKKELQSALEAIKKRFKKT